MDPSPKAVLKLLLPRLPLILKTAIFNALRISQNSSKQTLTTEVAVVIIRSIMGGGRPIKLLQRITTKDHGVKGPVWISKVTIPPRVDETDALDAVHKVIKELGDGTETYTSPDQATVEAEWTGYRHGVSSSEPALNLSDGEQYKNMMAEVSSDLTILYFHGGAYFLMDPATVRDNTGRLAKLTHGRVYSVRYRLAPQSPFPAQLLDALIAYLSLLSPPSGVPHAAVPANHIVFAGDSAGGNLAAALLLLILTLKRLGIHSLKYHGSEVPLDLPAGLALNSPWVDVSRSLPSINQNAHLDYLTPPTSTGTSKHEHAADEIWPARPPRADIFCNASMMLHPLVSPLSAGPGMWKGAPPIFMCLGNEALEDEIVVFARRLHQGGTIVDLVGYEGMPHCFAMLFATSLHGIDCYERWTTFCSDVVEGKAPTVSKALWIKAFSNPPKGTEIPMEDISLLKDEDVLAAMKRMQGHALRREEDGLKNWHEQTARAKL